MVLSSYLYDIWAADLLSKWSSDIWSTFFPWWRYIFQKEPMKLCIQNNLRSGWKLFYQPIVYELFINCYVSQKMGLKMCYYAKSRNNILENFLYPERAQKIELYQSSFNSPKRILPTHIVLKRHYFLVKILYWRNAEIAL
jgi:hypothetical protein